ncbi:related to tripeptidyl-peptidase I [Ramularia collo-cygni]|uniref:tripeptidyl-peptidase II n=1 Tax=Ramularia collo-cygni TaxID=112498 RepID=A0A2D3VGK0_9PEZI|nr:related to tripeptidyl-peptidase I [Ramularia collo-cygni]CZT24372.1 related to tripeptidyl-peptidase I [Ramularia collo-cygni]
MFPYSSLLLALATPLVHGAIHESLAALPFGWTQSTHSISASDRLTLQIAVKYRNLDKLEPLLEAVSTPGSPQYGHQIKSWLESHGIKIQSNDGTLMTFTTTVDKANTILNTTFAYFTNGATTKLGTTEYSIPNALTDSIDFVTPTTFFASTKFQRVLPHTVNTNKRIEKRQTFSNSCLETVEYEGGRYGLFTPECYKQQFNIGDYKVDVAAGSTVAFSSFLNESASFSDLALFEKAFSIPSQNVTKTVIQNGVSYNVNDQNPLTEQDGEANLDVQNIIGLADGLPVSEYITGGLPDEFTPDLLYPNASVQTNEPYLQYYQYLLSQKNADLPHVISNSYGDHENTVPENYAKRVCNMIGMMGLRGRTILESSGDEGVGAVCRANADDQQPQFTPQFPGTCPYVTAVGGSQFMSPVEAWNASSGGFSFYFPTAFYQKSAVNTYLTEHISPETKEYYSSNGYVDFGGRGFPDVTAHSLYPYVLTYINGTASPNGGTSSAAPAVAAVIALLNDVRFRAGKPALGFINPLLYGLNGAGLTDITKGAALGCNGTDLQNGIVIDGAGIIPFASWNATAGWDPATGLGIPNFGDLKELIL